LIALPKTASGTRILTFAPRKYKKVKKRGNLPKNNEKGKPTSLAFGGIHGLEGCTDINS
jgi:hypothetical protein